MVQSWLSEMQARLASPDAPAQIEALDKEIVRLKRAIDRLLDMIETGDNSREVRERLRQRQAELGTAEMERDALAQHRGGGRHDTTTGSRVHLILPAARSQRSGWVMPTCSVC